MKDSEIVNPDEKTYLLTKDIVPTLKYRLNVPISVGSEAKIERLENQFINQFFDYTNKGNTNVHLNHSELTNGAIDLLKKHSSDNIISCDEVYFPNGIADDYLSITRITDPGNPSNYKLGERPGNIPLKTQLNVLEQKYSGKKITLLDIGAFGGDSILDTVSILNDRNITVENIVLSVSNIDAINRINNETNLDIYSHKIYNFDDWIELRDLFGIDGRKINKTEVPSNAITSQQEFKKADKLFAPYWENPVKWATVEPEYKDQAIELSKSTFGELQKILIDDGFNVDMNKVAKDQFGIWSLNISK
ncbi:MAG: hypothetical protein K0B02_03000 [DPANN group archaeon]|nr:hypothetical protein [DPANN group archaeon]